MIVTHSINLDLVTEYILGVKIPQYTKDSHVLRVTVTENGSPRTFNTSNETVYCKIATPGNRYYYYPANLTQDYINYTIPAEATAYAGLVSVEFEIRNRVEDNIQATMKFNIVITPSVYDEGEITNSDIYTSLLEKLHYIEEKIVELDLALERIPTFEVTSEWLISSSRVIDSRID